MKLKHHAAIFVILAAGCQSIRDITDDRRALAGSPYQPGRTYRLTHDVKLQSSGFLAYLGPDPARPQMEASDTLVVSGTRFLIDKVILDDRIFDLQYHPLGALLDGPCEGRRIDLSSFEPGWAVREK